MRLFPYLFALFAFIGLSTGGEKISLVEELPDFQVKGEQVDACVVYKQFAILWVPLWNWDAQYIFAEEGAEYGFGLIDKGLLIQLEEKYGEAADAIPYWDKIGIFENRLKTSASDFYIVLQSVEKFMHAVL